MDPLSRKNEAFPDGDDAGGDIDRLSNLPDEILYYILSISGLQIFDVVELSLLSKRWNHLWLTMPYLDIAPRIKSVYCPRSNRILYSRESVEQTRSFINWVLTRQGVSRLIRFRMHSHSSFDNVQILRWLRVVAERNVQELDIDFVPSGGFRLPLFIAVNDSLRVLKVTLGEKVMSLPSVVRLNQLRSLHLTDVCFTDTALLQRLFSGCCSLETLRFDDCELPSFGYLDFSSPHLKNLFISFTFRFIEDDEFNFDIKISCPNLISFGFIAPVPMNFILENVSSLETACLELFWLEYVQWQPAAKMMQRILKELHNVKDLKLHREVLDNLFYTIEELKCCPPSFPNVKSLSLYIIIYVCHMEVMFLLLAHCPNLEVLTLENDNDCFAEEFDNEHWELQCEGTVSWISHTHLKAIKYDGFLGYDYELNFLRFLLKNAKSLEKLDIIWMFKSANSAEKIEEVLMFPKASSQIVVTFLCPYPDNQ